MPAVVEIISLLEKVAITKELLEVSKEYACLFLPNFSRTTGTVKYFLNSQPLYIFDRFD